MSTFGADVGTILRSKLSPLAKLTALVVRYHHPDGVEAKRVVEVSGICKTTTFELLNDLGKAGMAEKRDGRWHYSIPPHGMEPVRHTESPVRHTESPVRHTESPVRHTEFPLGSPLEEIQTFSRPSPDSAAPAGARVHETGLTPDPPQVPAEVPALRELHDLALDCTLVTSRRGRPMALDPVSVAKLEQLVAEHGPDAVRGALRECGGTERPVYMAASKLEPGRSKPGREHSAAGIARDWNAEQPRPFIGRMEDA